MGNPWFKFLRVHFWDEFIGSVVFTVYAESGNPILTVRRCNMNGIKRRAMDVCSFFF